MKHGYNRTKPPNEETTASCSHLIHEQNKTAKNEHTIKIEPEQIQNQQTSGIAQSLSLSPFLACGPRSGAQV